MKLMPHKRDESREIATTTPDPWAELFESFWKMPFPLKSRLPEAFLAQRMPLMNISEDEAGYHYDLDLPGLEEKDIQIQLMGRQVVITGERAWKEEKKEKEFHRVESQFGSFQRSFLLPDDARIEENVVDAVYEKGILKLFFPKVEPTPTKRIPIKSK